MSSDWPSFAIGPSDSIFALGVISVKFVELESIFQFVFETILGLDPNQGKIVFAKLGTGPGLQMSEDCLRYTKWSDDAKDHILHFLAAMKTCADNRNLLMHSHMAWRFGEETVLFKKSRSGSDLYLSIPLAQLRQVADEIDGYCAYARDLGNAINNTLEGVPVYSATAFPWPKKKPDLPVALKYSPLPNSRA